jgi:uncharacterized protein involved in exopolysaccharide biosynthesis
MEEFSVQDIWHTLRRQWWLIAIGAFLAALLAGLYTLFIAEQEWRATTSIIFETPQVEMSEQMVNMQLLLGRSLGSTSQEHFETIIRSRRVMQAVVEEHDLASRYDVENVYEAIELLQQGCTINEKSSRSLALTVTWLGPPRMVASGEENTQSAEISATIANSIIDELQTFLSEAEYTRATERRKFLGEQLDKAQQELVALEDALVEYATQHDLVEPSSQAQAAIRNLETLRAREAELSGQLSGARQAEQKALAELDSQERMAVSTVSEERNPQLDDLRSRILELRRQLTEQTEVEGKSDRHPDVQRLQAELDEAEQQLTDEVSSEMLTRTRQMQVDPRYTNLVTTALSRSLEREALEAQLSTIRAEKNQALSELSVLPSLSQEYGRLESQMKLKAEAVTRLTERYESARIAEAASLDYITILDRAVPPYKRSGPSLKKAVGAFGMAGLLLSTLLAFWLQGRRAEAEKISSTAPEGATATTSDR